MLDIKLYKAILIIRIELSENTLNLRSKFLIIIVGFLLLQGGIFYVYFKFFALPQVDDLEIAQAQKRSLLASNILQMQLAEVKQLTEIWAKQKPLAYFAQTNQIQNISLFYTKERLLEENIHAFFVIDKSFNVLSELSVDPISKTPMTLLNFVENLSADIGYFFHDEANKQPLSGFFMSARGPMMVSVKPILTQQQDKIGWVIMGRLLNSDMLSKINQEMGVDMSVFPLGVKEMPDKILNLIPVIKANPGKFHIETSGNTLNTYRYLVDLGGNPSIILYNAYPRDASTLVLTMMEHSLAVLLLINFILVLLLLKIINHAFVEPTRKISDFISQVTTHVESPPRIKYFEEDELGQLKGHLNEMIVTFCNHKEKSINKAYRDGADSIRHEMIEELTQITDQVVPTLNNLETRLWSLTLNPLEKLLAEVRCSRKDDIDWKYLEQTLDLNNDYLDHEVKGTREQLRRIKQQCLRIASILKSYSIDLNHTKPMMTAARFTKRANDE